MPLSLTDEDWDLNDGSDPDEDPVDAAIDDAIADGTLEVPPLLPPRRCPKCGAAEIFWTEEIIAYLEVHQSSGGVIDTEGHKRFGEPTKVTGRCDCCKHRWTARGIRQLTDLPGFPR